MALIVFALLTAVFAYPLAVAADTRNAAAGRQQHGPCPARGCLRTYHPQWPDAHLRIGPDHTKRTER